MNDPMMSAVYQTLPAPMDFPAEFLEPTVSAPMQQQTNPTNAYFSPQTGYASTNSSLSSSRNRVCDDSGISSNVTLSNDVDNTSSMHFLTSTLNTTVNDCMESSTPMNFANNDSIDDFEPMMRDRCNTWPLKHANTDFHTNNSPIMHDRIPEEESLYSQNGSQASIHLAQDSYINNHQINNSNNYQPQVNQHMGSREQELNYDSPPAHYSDGNSHDSADEDDYQGVGVQKRSQTRRNAWGNLSYADLITRAIESSPDQRLTLSQVYEWMVENVPYFSDKGDSNSSAGWKNSIRHNLSLHSRFMRIQNEGAGKSSWWVINPEAKASRNPRRRATMDASTKNAIEKKRRGARKRVELQMQGSMSSLAGGARKASQPDFYHNRTKDELLENDSDYDSFRSRTLSNISAPGGSQISPTFNPNDDFNYQPWAPNSTSIQSTPCNNTINEIMSKTDQICLDAEGEYSQQMDMTSINTNQQQLGVYSTMPQQISPSFQIKQEEIKPQFQQTSYQELKVVRGVNQQMQNPLLRNQFTQQSQFQQQPATPQFTSANQSPQQHQNGGYHFGSNRTAQQNWQMNNNQQMNRQFVQQQSNNFNLNHQQIGQNGIQQQQMTHQFVPVSNGLPKDLENLNSFVPSDCNVDEIDRIIRDELSTTSTIHFDF